MSRTKSEELAILVLELAKTNPMLMAEARELAIQVLGDHVVQELMTNGFTVDMEVLEVVVAEAGVGYGPMGGRLPWGADNREPAETCNTCCEAQAGDHVVEGAPTCDKCYDEYIVCLDNGYLKHDARVPCCPYPCDCKVAEPTPDKSQEPQSAGPRCIGCGAGVQEFCRPYCGNRV